MKHLRTAALIGAAIFSFSAFAAEPVPRVKAKLLSFDGKLLTIQPADAKDDKPVTLAITPTTQVMTIAPGALADVKQGAYAGAAVNIGKDGKLTAQALVLYPDALRGTGEGRFADKDVTRISGTVAAASATSLTLHYHGANLNGSVCEGRAPPPALASLMACTGDAVIALSSNTPVSMLAPGDTKMLQPGALLTVSLARNAQGDDITPGIIVETPKTVPKEASVEKPAANP